MLTRGRRRPASDEAGSPAPLLLFGEVTDVKPQERSSGRRSNVFLNGSYAFSLSAEIAVRLRVGQVLDGPEIQALVAEDEQQRATQAALIFLGARARSVQEVRDRLVRGGYDDGVIDRVVDRLRELYYLDDASFASQWVRQRQTFRPKGERALKAELAQRGVKAEDAALALEDVDTSTDAAYRAGEKRARQLHGLQEREFAQRLGDFLLRRGFTWEAIRPAVKRHWQELSAS